MSESKARLQREYNERCRELDQLRRDRIELVQFIVDISEDFPEVGERAGPLYSKLNLSEAFWRMISC